MCHQIHGAHLVAVQKHGSRAQHRPGSDGSREIFLQIKGAGHLVIGVAVAAQRGGGVKLHLRVGAAFAQGGRGQHRFGVDQLPVCKAGKGPVQDLRSFFINVIQVRAQHHQPIGVAVFLGKGHIAAPGQGGKAGFHAADVIAVIGIFRVEHQVGRGNRPLILVQVGGGQRVAQGVGDVHVGLVGGTGGGDQRQVMGCGDIAVIVQAVYTGKAGAGAAQLFGALVHPGHKGGQVAVCHVAGDHTGGIVGAGDQQAVQQVDPAHRLADAQVHGAAVGILNVPELLRQAGGNGDLRIQVLAAFQKQQGGHHFGQAGNVALLVGVLFQDGFVDVRIEQIDRFVLIDGLDGHFVHGKTGQNRRSGQCSGEQQRGRPAEER